MTNFFRPIFAIFLAILFVLAAIFGGPANGFDVDVMRRVAAVHADWPELAPLVTAITTMGSAPVTLGLAGLASLWLLLRRGSEQALLLAATVLGERLLVEGLKDTIGRPRPFDLYLLPHNLAYPSGHAANSMTAFLATAMIVSPPAYRRAAGVAALFLVTAVGLSRIYLGMHWPSDVVGGWVLGLLAVGGALTLGERSGALRFEAKHNIVGRHGVAPGEDEPA